MNGRIVELAKNPELFQINDLELINSELKKHPYMQSLRALHLLGTHRLQPENYKNELSITAAYTTDKKILYQLINSGKESKPSVEKDSEKIIEKPIIAEEKIKNKFTEVESAVIETPNPVFVKGELNRILFEGEEDFLERETETIDLESTIESGQIVTQKSNQAITSSKHPEFIETKDAENFSKETMVEEEIISEVKQVIENPKEVSFQEIEEFSPEVKIEAKEEILENKQAQEFTETADAENFSTEKVIHEEIISEEKPIIEDLSELSFQGTEEFLPEVKMIAKPIKSELKEVPKPTLNKHEEEMNQLIAEVEAKMKASKKQKISSTETDETSKSADVNFSETQSFEFSKSDENEAEITEVKTFEEVVEKDESKVAKKSEVQPTEIPKKSVEVKTETIQESKPEWKPMSFNNNTPDALISKKTEEIPVKKEEHREEKTESVKDKNQSAERPIFNVSFFSENVSSLNKKEETEPILETVKTAETAEDSNVPEFINTWQSWLKIDRNKVIAKEKIEISITEIKNKVIENFIEKEPKISKLKEESDFVIKERNDDISHLMTETLAKLYTDQKLFAKSIKAYEILSKKYPEKKSYFDDKIKSVKELRQNK